LQDQAKNRGGERERDTSKGTAALTIENKKLKRRPGPTQRGPDRENQNGAVREGKNRGGGGWVEASGETKLQIKFARSRRGRDAQGVGERKKNSYFLFPQNKREKVKKTHPGASKRGEVRRKSGNGNRETVSKNQNVARSPLMVYHRERRQSMRKARKDNNGTEQKPKGGKKVGKADGSTKVL